MTAVRALEKELSGEADEVSGNPISSIVVCLFDRHCQQSQDILILCSLHILLGDGIYCMSQDPLNESQ